MKKLLALLIALLSAPLAHAMESEEPSQTIYIISECEMGAMLIRYNRHKEPEGSHLAIQLNTIPQVTLTIPKPILAQTPLGTIAKSNHFPMPCIEYQTTMGDTIEMAFFYEKSQTYGGGSCRLNDLSTIEYFSNQIQAQAKFNQFKAAFEAAQNKN